LNQKEAENSRRKVVATEMMKQKNLDNDFMERLKSYDLDVMDDNEDMQ
jgi:hypothetical protein